MNYLNNNENILSFVKDFSYPLAYCDVDFFNHFVSRYVINDQLKKEIQNDIVIFNQYYKYCDDHNCNPKELRKNIEQLFVVFLNNHVDKITNIQYKPLYNIPNQNVYNCNNVGKYFISVDLIKANFQVFKYFCFDEITSHNNSFDALVEYLCPIEDESVWNYVKQSKSFRQYIFGSVQPNKQNICEKIIIQSILQNIELKFPCVFKHLYKIDHDEIIFCFDNIIDMQNHYDILVNHNCDVINQYDIKVETFQLNCIGELEQKYFIKNISNSFIQKDNNKINKTNIEKISFKCISKNKFLQVLNKYNNIDNIDMDMQFMIDGDLVRYI